MIGSSQATLSTSCTVMDGERGSPVSSRSWGPRISRTAPVLGLCECISCIVAIIPFVTISCLRFCSRFVKTTFLRPTWLSSTNDPLFHILSPSLALINFGLCVCCLKKPVRQRHQTSVITSACCSPTSTISVLQSLCPCRMTTQMHFKEL